MQVAVTAAGGEVKKATKGSHRGIASNIEINENGLNHPLYKNKNQKFNTPAFNFDEVVTMPENSILLASNSINNVQVVLDGPSRGMTIVDQLHVGENEPNIDEWWSNTERNINVCWEIDNKAWKEALYKTLKS